MKRIPIPMFRVTVRVYGADELDAFIKRTKSSAEDCADAEALQHENCIFIGDLQHSSCYHEANHFADWLVEDWLECRFEKLNDSKELRTYIMEYVGAKVWDYIKP